jgi:tight adherence protein C
LADGCRIMFLIASPPIFNFQSSIFNLQFTIFNLQSLLLAFAPPISFLDLLLLLGSSLFGLAAGGSAWWLLSVLTTEDLRQGEEWRYDVSRINELRRLDLVYRFAQPAIGLLARINRVILRDGLPEIQRQIQAAGMSRFWLAEEYMGKLDLLAFLMFPAFAYFFVGMMGTLNGLLVSLVMVILTTWFLRRRLAARAAARLRQIKRRMPFLLDLLTLLMEAGSTFLNALKQGVEEFHGHPVAEEFGRVLSDINLGKTRQEAFESMRRRLQDDEIASIVGSILQGEQLGTPLARIFRTQADVLRIKRSQRAETVAGEAAVNMLLPGVVVMAATVLIILGPVLLNYLYIGLTF